ncbi:MAG: hypothetical protein ACKVXR_18275 [Planctomycetota bacterium]
MNPSKFSALLLGAGLCAPWPARASTIAVSPAPAAAPAPFDSICQSTANAARTAARRDAQHEYWIAIAKCLNGPGYNSCREEAEDALEEALELAQVQYGERLAVCSLLGQGAYNPAIDPDDFSATIDNSYLPFVPGRTLVYEKMTPDGLERVEVTTLAETVEINGVECRQVRDVVTLDGEFVEDTIDFYAQDEDGNVLYFGEVVQNFEDGFLDNLDGSWRYGKDGAKPGIVMLGDPDPNDAYRAEFLVGEAEDIIKVLSVGQAVQVGARTFQNCVKTKDWTPLEPDKFEHKFYAPGIGLVMEFDPEHNERLELVQIID